MGLGDLCRPCAQGAGFGPIPTIPLGHPVPHGSATDPLPASEHVCLWTAPTPG